METTEKKPSRKRVAVGQPFWTMARNENGELEPKQYIEVEEEKGKTTMSFNEACFVFGNYYHSEDECFSRIELLKNK
jgi:hypothetical protein